jgi:hypothetical protein
VESRSALDKANLLKNELCQTLSACCVVKIGFCILLCHDKLSVAPEELEAEHSYLEAAYGAVVSKEKEVSASLQLCEIRYAASSADKAELQHKVSLHATVSQRSAAMILVSVCLPAPCLHGGKGSA